MSVVQAVEEEGEDAKSDEFGGGVLRKRQKAARHEQQFDGDAADLQQVTLTAFSTICFQSLRPDRMGPDSMLALNILLFIDWTIPKCT